MSSGGVVRWRVMPDGAGVRLELEFVGDVVTEHVHVGLSGEAAEQLAEDLFGSAQRVKRGALAADLEARH